MQSIIKTSIAERCTFSEEIGEYLGNDGILWALEYVWMNSMRCGESINDGKSLEENASVEVDSGKVMGNEYSVSGPDNGLMKDNGDTAVSVTQYDP